MKTFMKVLVVALAISAVSFMAKCTNVEFVSASNGGQGGSTEVSVIAGRLVEPDGVTPATGASVVMRPRDYLAAVPLLGKRRATGAFWACTTTTDSIGAYRFTSGDSIPAGVYCIEGRDAGGNRVLIDSVMIGANAPSTPFIDTLRPPAAIRGKVPMDTEATEALIRVFGLDVAMRSGPDGAFLLGNLPQGELRLQRLVLRDGEQLCDTTVVAVTAGDTVIIGNLVSFDSRGGSAVDSQTVVYGGYAAEPPPPTNKACGFAGWFKEPACTSEWRFQNDKVSAPTTLYAKWTVRDVDGNVYTTVKIGNQVWLAENLKTTRFNDSTEIPWISDSTWANRSTPAYCWSNKNSSMRGNPYGATYNWYAVNTGRLAPAGWHVSRDDEWDALQDTLLSMGYVWGGTTETTIVKALAAKSDWLESSYGIIGDDPTSNNRTGFSALPGGIFYGVAFQDIGRRGCWWSAKELNADDAVHLEMRWNGNSIVRFQSSKTCGLNVRCVRDK